MDNGYASFDRVRIPRANMRAALPLERLALACDQRPRCPPNVRLTSVPAACCSLTRPFGRHLCDRPCRYVTLTREGRVARTPGANPRVAYITMLGVRAMLISTAAEYLARGCTVAVRYSAVRKQGFSQSDATFPAEELPILDYRLQQYRLLPLLCTACAARLASPRSAAASTPTSRRRPVATFVAPSPPTAPPSLPPPHSPPAPPPPPTARFVFRWMGFAMDASMAELKREIAAGDFGGLQDTHATSSGLKASCLAPTPQPTLATLAWLTVRGEPCCAARQPPPSAAYPPCRHQAVCTRLCADGLEECRKACGGHGYLEASGLPELLNTYLANCTPAAVKSAPP